MGLDEALAEVGHFGRFQLRSYVLLFGALSFSAYYSISYVFTAATPEYRCYVPGCDDAGQDYDTGWLQRAVPFVKGKPELCTRYQSADNSSCSSFDRDNTVTCTQFVFQSSHTSIAKSFGIYCRENQWMLTIVGSLNNLGQFVGMPLVGYLSDRVGRKKLLSWCLVLSTVVGLIKSFSPTYVCFVLLEILEAIVGDGIYSGGIIMGVEYSGAARRAEAISILSCSYSIGESLLGLAAWYVLHWRNLLRLIYLPGFLFITYFWLLPESMRWLAAQGRKSEALAIFREIETTNNVFVSEDTRNNLFENAKESGDSGSDQGKEEDTSAVKEIFRSAKMTARVLVCSYVWMIHTLMFYGLSLNSVAVAGNSYVNFVLVSLAEIPGYLMAALLLKMAGRRVTLISCLLICSTSCFLFHFVPADQLVTGQCLYFMSKCSITASFTILYMFTTEMFPTNLRHSLLGVCSMFGRIGSMIAPQAPLMANYVDPLLIFAGMTYAAAALVLLFPETANTKLPDSVQEAQTIGEEGKPPVGEITPFHVKE